MIADLKPYRGIQGVWGAVARAGAGALGDAAASASLCPDRERNHGMKEKTAALTQLRAHRHQARREDSMDSIRVMRDATRSSTQATIVLSHDGLR